MPNAGILLIDCLCRLRRHGGKCERNEDFLRLERGVFTHPLSTQPIALKRMENLSHSLKNRKSGDSSCAISWIVCADCVGMEVSVKRISKSAKDADKEILKLHTEERKNSVLHRLFVPPQGAKPTS